MERKRTAVSTTTTVRRAALGRPVAREATVLPPNWVWGRHGGGQRRPPPRPSPRRHSPATIRARPLASPANPERSGAAARMTSAPAPQAPLRRPPPSLPRVRAPAANAPRGISGVGCLATARAMGGGGPVLARPAISRLSALAPPLPAPAHLCYPLFPLKELGQGVSARRSLHVSRVFPALHAWRCCRPR